MSETASRTVDIKPWIDRARRNPAAYTERQAMEIVLTAIGSLPDFRDKCMARGICPLADSLNDPRIALRARAEWNSLKQEIGELPDFDACFAKVEALYRTLPWSAGDASGFDR